MAEQKKPPKKRKPRIRSTGMAEEHERITRKRRSRRPLGLGEMSQKDFPLIAVVNGETMLVDRIGQRIVFTPWI